MCNQQNLMAVVQQLLKVRLQAATHLTLQFACFDIMINQAEHKHKPASHVAQRLLKVRLQARTHLALACVLMFWSKVVIPQVWRTAVHVAQQLLKVRLQAATSYYEL